MTEILAEGVVKTIGRARVLDNIHLSVPSGELWGLVGADGAGKTTLLRCISGLLSVDSGQVFPGRKGQHDLGFSQQGFHLYGDLTVEENVSFVGRLYGLDRFALAESADELLGFAGLEDRRGSLAGELSGGMKQKLTLVCSLLHRPPVLLLDEPTTGVDPLSRLEFWDLIEQLHASGSTILFASSYFDEVERCDHAIYLDRGRIAASGSPEELKGDHPTLEDAFLELTK